MRKGLKFRAFTLQGSEICRVGLGIGLRALGSTNGKGHRQWVSYSPCQEVSEVEDWIDNKAFSVKLKPQTQDPCTPPN